jgi:hypothetical protein
MMGEKPTDERSLESIQSWMKHADFETRVKYWMKSPGYEILAGEPHEVSDEIRRRRLESDIRQLLDERRFSVKQLRQVLDVLEDNDP